MKTYNHEGFAEFLEPIKKENKANMFRMFHFLHPQKRMDSMAMQLETLKIGQTTHSNKNGDNDGNGII